MANIFTRHAHSIDETYAQHFKFAFFFGCKMVGGGLACIVHSVFPFWFERTGTLTANYLADLCRERCKKLDEVAARKEQQKGED